MQKNYKKYGSLLLSGLIVFLLGYYLYENRQIFLEIKKINFYYSIPLVIIIFAYLYINGLFLKTFTDPFNIKLKEHFLLSIATSFFNMITPFRAGMGVRAVYLKKKYNLDYSKFMAGFFGNYIVILLITSIIAELIFLGIYLEMGIYNSVINILFLGMLCLCLFAMFYKKTFKGTGRIVSIINNIITGWSTIVKHPNLILYASIFTIINFLLTTLSVYIIFSALGQNINLFQSLFFSIMSSLAFFINITPGSLGITEGLFAITGKIVNISPEIALLVALIYRFLTTIILLITGPIANYLLLKKLKEKQSTTPSIPS